MHFLSHIYVVVVVIIDGSLVCVIMHFIHIHAIFTSLLMAVYAFVKKYKMKNSRRTMIVCREQKKNDDGNHKTYSQTQMQSAKCEVKEISSLSFIFFSLSCIYSLAYTKKEERNCKLCVFSSHNISPATPFLSFSSSSSLNSHHFLCVFIHRD